MVDRVAGPSHFGTPLAGGVEVHAESALIADDGCVVRSLPRGVRNLGRLQDGIAVETRDATLDHLDAVQLPIEVAQHRQRGPGGRDRRLRELEAVEVEDLAGMPALDENIVSVFGRLRDQLLDRAVTPILAGADALPLGRGDLPAQRHCALSVAVQLGWSGATGDDENEGVPVPVVETDQ
ncbi:MAG: hypothetical protein DMG07_17175 [Acidobacteria bacterium]|nr:MAG: hypothetical protein DMG07_17175 [Acidobacteriota bacterium]